MSKITKIVNICFGFALASLFACKEAPKNSAPTDKAAITDVVQNFYNWYPPAGIERIEYVDSEGEFSKLDMANVAAYHALMMKSGFLSQAYIDNDLAYLKQYEAIWATDKENNNEAPLSGYDYDRVYCGQDWDPKEYTTGTPKVDLLGTNQAKVTVGASKLELVKENGKWLISKISCE
ncbi:MAG TPA: hypothetical protein PLC89_24225 [Haliscomenobacter sp.]|uniref:hypothetical protein n=1 Tax=Haliscomenobacter sp. TaxID=2717303 RepID=UPI002C49BF98|nr:hypothetical protein [Haliscomenobacter sp.]HOY20441.1 hypothetical protein [Haliscomenobacter sp.]